MHHCAILDGYLLEIFRLKSFLFFFCVACGILVHLNPRPLLWKVESQPLDTGEVPWKGFLSLIMPFGLKQHQGNLRRTDSQQWKTGRLWRGLEYIFLSSDRKMVERPFGPEPLSCTENNIWHILRTVHLVRRMHVVSLGMGGWGAQGSTLPPLN